jgi:hypothetical protein
MVGDRSNQLLGELLTEAGLIQIDDLREAANIARGQNLPIGKVLVMSGYISKELLHAAVEIQSRLKDNLINYEIALKALSVVSKTNCSLEEALKQLGLELPGVLDSTTYRLGALLLGSSLISQADYDVALSESQRNGLPLGRVLTNLSILSEKTIDSALEVQKLLRIGQISKEEAIQNLIQSKKEKLTEENKSSKEVKDKSILDENNPVAPSTDAPLKSINSIDLGKSEQAQTKNKTKKPFPSLESLTLHHMLLMSGLVQTDVLETAIKDGLKQPEIMGAILKRSAILEDFVIDAAEECCQLIASGQLKPEQAIIALHHCQRTRNSVKDCLDEFGWFEKSEIIW